MTKRKVKDLQVTIEAELVAMFDAATTPDDGRMKLVTLGIKYLAVKNKLEENEFGSFFDEPGNAEKPARQESATRRRANGAGTGAAAGSGGFGEA